jgi:hypothetical protein
VWARSYAQTVLTRSSDALLQGHLAGLIGADDVFVWPADEFGPLAAAVVSTLERLGLLRAAAARAA